jgi:hypothetical protein
MNTNTPDTPSAAQGATAYQFRLNEDEKQIIETDFSNLMFTFSAKDAARLGLSNGPVSLGYIEYLLDGHVAPEDEETSEQMIALMDEHVGPGWR